MPCNFLKPERDQCCSNLALTFASEFGCRRIGCDLASRRRSLAAAPQHRLSSYHRQWRSHAHFLDESRPIWDSPNVIQPFMLGNRQWSYRPVLQPSRRLCFGV